MLITYYSSVMLRIRGICFSDISLQSPGTAHQRQEVFPWSFVQMPWVSVTALCVHAVFTDWSCWHARISAERHRAEIRRAVNDELLTSVAARYTVLCTTTMGRVSDLAILLQCIWCGLWQTVEERGTEIIFGSSSFCGTPNPSTTASAPGSCSQCR